MNQAERRRAAHSGQRPGPVPGPAHSDEDRVFHATANYEVSRQWVPALHIPLDADDPTENHALALIRSGSEAGTFTVSHVGTRG